MNYNKNDIFEKEAQGAFYDLFKHLPVGIAICDKNGNFTAVNEPFCNLTGYSEEALLHMSFKQITHPDYHSKDQEMLTLLLNGTVSEYTIEKRYIRQDKTIIWVKLKAAVIPATLKNPISLIGTIEDITALKQAQESTLKMYEILKYILTQTSQKTGIAYFEAMVLVLCETLEADYAHIGILQPDGQTIKTIAICSKGEILPEIEYCLKSLPCETLVNKLTHTYNTNATSLFPPDLIFQELEIKGYTGVPLFYKTGDPMGLMVCLYKKPIDDSLFSETIIKLFSDRAVSEYEQLKYQEQLLQAREKAVESDHLKTAFLQNMSHEIRTPLNAIIGFSEILPECYNKKEKLNKYVSIIQQSGSILIELINDILDIAKIESGQLPVHPEKCNLSSMFQEIESFFNEYRKRINKQHVGFILKIEQDFLDRTIILDQMKLKQILINLIGNAFKFTSCGYVEVGCTSDDNNFLSFYVKDTGIGIPANKHSEIFERFMQASINTSKHYGGTGLGLSIVKGLLKLLGGKIWLTSTIGEGTTFYVLFPYETVNQL